MPAKLCLPFWIEGIFTGRRLVMRVAYVRGSVVVGEFGGACVLSRDCSSQRCCCCSLRAWGLERERHEEVAAAIAEAPAAESHSAPGAAHELVVEEPRSPLEPKVVAAAVRCHVLEVPLPHTRTHARTQHTKCTSTRAHTYTRIGLFAQRVCVQWKCCRHTRGWGRGGDDATLITLGNPPHPRVRNCARRREATQPRQPS